MAKGNSFRGTIISLGLSFLRVRSKAMPCFRPFVKRDIMGNEPMVEGTQVPRRLEVEVGCSRTATPGSCQLSDMGAWN